MTDAAKLALRPVVRVIDDDAALRGALANLLRSAAFDVAEFPSPQHFIEAWRPSDCGCLLLDIQFPGMNGLDFQARFREVGIAMPIILMTGHADVPSSIRGLKSGAIDFLVKPFDDADLVEAVTTALQKDAKRSVSDAAVADVTEKYASLTSREKEVLALVVEGLMNKQIAFELSLSEITVKVHRGTMMRKMKVRTVADLVRASEILKAQSGA
ncbi:response regulator transcription factor [Bosea sp. TAB14]|uniref:response regulator transcription factor n=1 Tax=Bosea sp. TAB14 TaxID=3237481 RepID=UPI003F9172A4